VPGPGAAWPLPMPGQCHHLLLIIHHSLVALEGLGPLPAGQPCRWAAIGVARRVAIGAGTGQWWACPPLNVPQACSARFRRPCF